MPDKERQFLAHEISFDCSSWKYVVYKNNKYI